MGKKSTPSSGRRRVHGVAAVCLVSAGGLVVWTRKNGVEEAPVQSTPIVRGEGASYEKPVAVGRRDWKAGSTWFGAWRAQSEPGQLYMAGPSLKARRLAAFSGTIDEALRQGFHVTQSQDSISVDAVRWNCSEATRKNYPMTYRLRSILDNWPPDTITVPPRHYASLCRFDYQDPDDLERAYALRDAELPFVVYNALDETASKWSTPGFLEKRLGTKRYRCEKSDDNHFMYFSNTRRLRGWSRPTIDLTLTYAQWLEHARRAYNLTVLDSHIYFRVSPPDMKPEDVPIFGLPMRGERSLFLREPAESKGVHCRFGAAGIVAEAHYDGSRNMIAQLGGPPAETGHPNSGRRRYIVAAPDQCDRAYLLPRGHPSARHSMVDWSRPVDADKFPLFDDLRATEVILEPGDVLYLPHIWLHYIVSLGTNFQCNARSGRNAIGLGALKKCGFM